MKIKYRYVFNRSNRLNKMGLGLIQIEAYLEKKKAYFSTHIYIGADQFDGLVVNHPHAAELNAMLTDLVIRLENIELDLWKNGIVPTLKHLRTGWKESHLLTDFVSFSRNVVTMSSRKESTKQNLMQTISKIAKYRQANISEIDYLYLKGFEMFLRDSHISRNTIQKEMSNLRTLMSEAEKAGLVKENPFDRYHMPKMEKKAHVVLTEEELQQLEQSSIYDNVRQAFLFCCHTGMRYSDYVQLTARNFCQIQGKQWLVYRTVKTETEVRIPIYLLGNLPHPAISCNAVVNRQLKVICHAAGISKPVTFHTSRHTFATRMLTKGVPITSVQQMLGHSSVKMTERYTETTMYKIEADLCKALLPAPKKAGRK